MEKNVWNSIVTFFPHLWMNRFLICQFEILQLKKNKSPNAAEYVRFTIGNLAYSLVIR